MIEDLKRSAAAEALKHVESGMRLGLGTGSTAKHFVDLLGAKVASGFDCICVPTSEVTARQAESLNIPLTSLDDLTELDLTVDGADEIDPQLALIKGAGGALLREKIVATASRKMIVIADESKLVQTLGKFPLPIEINKFAAGTTVNALKMLSGDKNANTNHDAKSELPLSYRLNQDNSLYETDGGHLIVDASFGRISDPKALSNQLLDIPGVVQHGLFLDLCDLSFVATQNGVTKIEK